MVLKINYNKSTGSITVESDLSAVNVEIGENTIVDTDTALDFEIAVDTSEYEKLNEEPTE